MLTDKASSVAKDCPSRESLLAYVTGKLPSQILDSVADHIDSCALCQSSLEELQGDTLDSDSLVGKLRRCVAEQPSQGSTREAPQAAQDKGASTLSGSQTVPVVPAARAPSGRMFGRYELLERIGHGGMGIVHKARHPVLDRLVALKLIGSGANASPDERKRFKTEGQAMARLQHPNVVQVHDIDEVEGQFYLCMEYLEGGRLSDRLAGTGLPLREAAGLVKTLAEAVHAAHQRNIIHRDLKPSNVLFAADGKPKISDFGLAKLQDTETTHTSPDAIMGTPSYMAPEQASPRGNTIGPLTDVYSLGAILYECLTGQPPFKGASKLETLDLVVNKEPVPPRSLRPTVPRDLQAICLKCLEKKPGWRYASAQELALDLGRWLDGQPPKAQPRPWYVIFWRRLPKRIVAAGVVIVGLIAGLILGFRPPDPDVAVKDIEARLAKDEAVTLIGETGKPGWWHLRTGKEAQTSLAQDEVFRIETWGRTCLELIRDPQTDSYRISAEVRHEQGGPLGQVGLFGSIAEYPLGDESAYFFVALAFDDMKENNAPASGSAPGMLKRNSVYLGSQIHWEGKSGLRDAGTIAVPPRVFFEPSGPLASGQPWRQLVLEVTKEGVRGTWAREELVGELAAKEINERTKMHLDYRREHSVPGALPGALTPGFNPRTSCGLYVNKGAASFRNVVIEPILE